MSPRVSIIVTVYRRTTFLSIAIESALRQTYQDREIIVVDDSGEALAQEICARFAGQIKYHANPRTTGIAESLRNAITITSGDYISILNDDDMWEPTFLEKPIPPLELETSRVLAFSDHWIMHEDGTVDVAATDANARHYTRATLPQGDVRDPADLVLKRNGVPLAMASVFRKNALDLNLLTSDVVGAYDFWIACILATKGGFYYVPDRLTRYRLHREMETARRAPDKNLPLIYMWEQILSREWFPELRSYSLKRVSEAYFRCGRDSLWFGDKAAARRMFRTAFKKFPGWKPAVALGLSLLPRVARRRLHLER